MNILIAEENDLLQQADTLLYQELWKPIGLKRNVRENFKTGTEEVVLVALHKNQVVGTFVLVIHQYNIAEIRHAAVASEFQSKTVGKQLFKKFMNYLQSHPEISKIEVYSRNTSVGFWLKMGFIESSDWLDHDLFSRKGIRFKKMTYILNR